jgi:hypothetical protein
MTSFRTALALLAAVSASGALAQTQQPPPKRSDPIGDILAQPAGKTPAVPEEPDTAAPAAQAKPATPAAQASQPPAAATPSVSAYDARVRASFAAAERYQGPLDGGWTLTGDDGADLYVFKLVDKGRGSVEGAWRDLAKAGPSDGSGFVDEAQRSGGQLTLRFAGATATLRQAGEGRWTGQLDKDGAQRAVTLRRTAP